MSSMKLITSNKDYGITKDGQVYSYRFNRYLKAADNGLGYKFVRIGGKIHYVHRLVAYAYLPRPAGVVEVNHKDKDRANNKLENLEWITHSENMYHAIDKVDAQLRFNSYIDSGVDPDVALYSLT